MLALSSAGTQQCWPSAVLALSSAGPQQCWHSAVPALSSAGPQQCWPSAVLALSSAGPQQCWPSAVLALSSAGTQQCWPSAVPALSSAGPQQCWHKVVLAGSWQLEESMVSSHKMLKAKYSGSERPCLVQIQHHLCAAQTFGTETQLANLDRFASVESRPICLGRI